MNQLVASTTSNRILLLQNPQPKEIPCHPEGSLRVMLSDTSRSIKESVWWGSAATVAMVDTGAALSVLSPTLFKRNEFLLRD